jgi:tRNA dimethylallyltransferase
VDVIDPDERYSAARFREEAIAAIRDIRARGQLPLVVGGTMLYFRALAEGFDDLPEANPEMRAAIDAQAARDGWPALHAELARLDPATAARLQPTDAQRIQRALEICRLTGRPMSAQIGARAAGAAVALRAFAVPTPDRAALHARLAERFDAMLAAGLLDELRALRARYRLSPRLPSMRCVGYRQAWEFLEGRYDAAELRERGIAATRQLAKRQLTWLRSFRGVEEATPDALRRALSD